MGGKKAHARLTTKDQGKTFEGNVIVGVCVADQPKHLNGNFGALTRLIRNIFPREQESVRIAYLYDSSYKYTLAIDDPKGRNPDDHELGAISTGNAWFASQRKYLEPGFIIVRHSDIEKEPEFIRIKRELDAQCDLSETFRTAIDNDAQKYIARLAHRDGKKLPDNFNQDRAMSLAREYVKGELAGAIFLANRYDANYFAYPGQPNESIGIARELLLPEGKKHLIRWLKIVITKPKITEQEADRTSPRSIQPLTREKKNSSSSSSSSSPSSPSDSSDSDELSPESHSPNNGSGDDDADQKLLRTAIGTVYDKAGPKETAKFLAYYRQQLHEGANTSSVKKASPPGSSIAPQPAPSNGSHKR